MRLTDEIARAFLSSEATIAQRIVRAKKTIAKAGQGCGHADPQRAGEGLSSRTGGRLRRPALNPDQAFSGSRRTGTPLRTALPESHLPLAPLPDELRTPNAGWNGKPRCDAAIRLKQAAIRPRSRRDGPRSR